MTTGSARDGRRGGIAAEALTPREVAYLQAHELGRLATVGPRGAPHVVPVAYRYDVERGSVRIGQALMPGRGQERRYLRHLRADPRAAFVVDDLEPGPGWRASGVLVHGRAVIHEEGGEAFGPGFGPRWLEIVPRRASSWGV